MNKFKRSCFSLCLAFCLCVGFLLTDSIKVYAYKHSENFYIYDTPISITFNDGRYNEINFSEINISDDGKYYLNNDIIYDIVDILILNDKDSPQWTFPYLPDVYDYYLLGSMVGMASDRENSTFKPRQITMGGWDFDNNWSFRYNLSNTVIYDIDGGGKYGFGFFTKVDYQSSNNIGINHFAFGDDVHTKGNKPANISIELGIMAVEKGTSEEQTLSQILSQLNKMESSINNSIGNAADQVTDSIENQYQVNDNEDFGVGEIQTEVDQKLGVLNFGADTLNNFLGLFSSSNAGDTIIIFPGFSMTIQGVKYQLWNDIQFDLSFLDQHFGILMTAVRTITVLSVWLAVLQYLVKAKDQLINNRG